MSASLKSVAGLVEQGLLPVEASARLSPIERKYAISLTPHVADIVRKSPPGGPLARQYLPSEAELQIHPRELADPIGDAIHSPVKGIVHRYPDRVLLKAVHVCPVYCRFCFRREVVGPGGEGTLTAEELAAAIDYIATDPRIWEVIFTGGDPFILSPRRLTDMLAMLENISHVKVVRFHTRVPVVDPGRIDEEFAAALQSTSKAVFVALHANHPDEFTPQSDEAIRDLIKAGLSLVSQSVLLRGVNDDADVLARLMRSFVERGIKPYYLHHPDLAPGTAHFRLSIEEGRALVGRLRGQISGLCMPTYVLDTPGGHGKVALEESSVEKLADGRYSITDRFGNRHCYDDTEPNQFPS